MVEFDLKQIRYLLLESRTKNKRIEIFERRGKYLVEKYNEDKKRFGVGKTYDMYEAGAIEWLLSYIDQTQDILRLLEQELSKGENAEETVV